MDEMMPYYDNILNILKEKNDNPGPLYECTGEQFKCLKSHNEVGVSQATVFLNYLGK